jgi:predicted helicase
MMAPYVIAHMKVGLKLAETGYRFATEERARIYLTNALEPAKDHSEELQLGVPALAIEASQVNEVKRHIRFTVVIGNPPYSNFGSANVNEWIDGQMLDFWGNMKGESKVNLYDDYIKFIRLAFKVRPEIGVVGMITNRSFLDGATQREMRNYLISNSQGARILDLYRGIYDEKKDMDENVFDITTGVAISLWWKALDETSTRITFGRLVGTYADKAKLFLGSNVESLANTEIRPAKNDYLLIPINNSRTSGLTTKPLPSFFRESTTGVQTNRDALAVDLDAATLLGRIKKFAESEASAKGVLGLCQVPETKFWNATDARKELNEEGVSKDKVHSYAYRPFDFRYIYFSPAIVHCPRELVSRAVVGRGTLCILASRGVDMPTNGVAFVSSCAADKRAINSARGEAKIFPVVVPIDEAGSLLGQSDISNFEIPGDWTYSKDKNKVIAAVYALLNAPSYLAEFAEQLRLDYPPIPLPATASFFEKLAEKGKVLIGAHTLSDIPGSPKAQFKINITGKPIETASWDNETIWIDKQKLAGFANVTREMWDLHLGGYRVCKKWLDERSGKTLSAVELDTFGKILSAVETTVTLRIEIDNLIKANGGWPKAFK